MTVIVVLLAGCSSWHGAGTVIQKDYSPQQINSTQRCYSSAKTMHCIPSTTVQPETWELRIRDATGKTHSVSVSEGEYNAADIGGSFSNGESE
jgi:hypothetical protein